MVSTRQRPEFAIDERNDLAREVGRVIADRGRIHVLIPTERREAVRKHEDRRTHPPVADKPCRTLRYVVAERLPVGVRESGAGEADQVVQYGEAALACALVVLRG